MRKSSKKGGPSETSGETKAQEDASKAQEDALKKAVEKAVRRMTWSKEREYFRSFLTDLIRNNAIPVELLDLVPGRACLVGKTRFDQLYDAASYLVFPKYRKTTLERLLGEQLKSIRGIKIWRVVLPEKFKVAQVLIRASSFQEAFALGCDYACRLSLRVYRKIPADLTIRVMFMSEKAVRRILDMRMSARVNKRKQLQLVGRKYSMKEINGARIVALGHASDQSFQIVRYAERKDLLRILHSHDLIRISAVETESLKKDLYSLVGKDS